MARKKSGKKQAGGGGTPASKKGGKKGGMNLNRDEMNTEVDDFMEQRDTVSLDKNKSDSENEDSEDYHQEVSSEEDSDDDDNELYRPIPVPGEDDDDEDYDTKRQRALKEEANISTAWGKKKKDYYGAETNEFELMGEDEQEVIEDEEQESRRLQAEAAEDIDEDDLDISRVLKTIVTTDTKGKKGKKGKKAKQSDEELLKGMDLDTVALGKDGMSIEKVGKELSKMSKEEKQQLLLSDTPELLMLLEDFKPMLKELKDHVSPLVTKVKAGELPTNKGVSLLEVKMQLLLAYCTNLCFYLMLKAEGKPVKNHPVIKQLAVTRTILEKIRSVDAKLKYQVDKLVRMAAMGPDHVMSQKDPLSFKPKPAALEAKNKALKRDEDAGEEKYKPARMSAVEFDANEKQTQKRKEAMEKARAKAMKSSLVQELRSEIFSDRPEEIESTGNKKQDEHLQDRQNYEEDNFLRLMETKADRKKRKAAQRIRSNEDLDMEYFGDLNPLVEAERQEQLGGTAFEPRRSKTAELIAKAAKARNTKMPAWMQDDFDMEGGASEYSAAKKQNKKKKEQHKEAHPDPVYQYNDVDPTMLEEGTRREASRMIIKNRGLTRYRSKETHNPRSAKRAKYEKKVTKRKSTVQDFKGTTHDYGGEKSGIKTNLVRSTKLGKS